MVSYTIPTFRTQVSSLVDRLNVLTMSWRVSDGRILIALEHVTRSFINSGWEGIFETRNECPHGSIGSGR
jgi:hypothetical protein